MNRAVRRQQRAAEATQKAAAPKSSTRTAIPRSTSPSKTQRSERGLRRFVPRFGLDIYNELAKVVWPSRDDTLYMAVVVVIVTLIFGAILGGIDFFFAYVIDKSILDPNAIFR